MRPTRRHALALLGTTALAASCAPALVTRDANDPFEGGIGGTGIVGTLYGFGSLLMNGLRVELGSGTRYRSAFGPLDASALATGQSLTVVARRRADGIIAQVVTVDYALVGPLQTHRGAVQVNGVPLIGVPETALQHASGTRVAVSGTWTPTGVRPNRMDPAPAGPDLIAGTLTEAADGSAGIGGTRFIGRATLPRFGAYTVAFGRSDAEGFAVARIQSDRFEPSANLRLLSVDGYLEPSLRAPGFRIAGLGHNFSSTAQLESVGARRAVYFGRYDGLFGASRAFIVPDGFEAHAAALRGGVRETFSGPVIRL